MHGIRDEIRAGEESIKKSGKLVDRSIKLDIGANASISALYIGLGTYTYAQGDYIASLACTSVATVLAALTYARIRTKMLLRKKIRRELEV